MNPFDQTKPPPEGEGDEVIDLTEVIEESPAEAAGETLPQMADTGPAEVVLDYRAGSDDRTPLKFSVKPVEPREEKPPASQEESLDDFLASLPDLPEDLDISPEAPPPPRPQAAVPPQDPAGRLSDAELRDMVREIVQERVDRLARELFPQLAAEAIERELNRLKKRLTEPD
jgi:hypothetical protein|uniref:Uncharacterized protein n=1 Tax=Desulfobacca acetoxidans TaxID=60893 RepID=A0A7V6A575_9BACT